MLRAILWTLCLLGLGLGQTPEGYFRSAGAGFRNTAEEQQIYWRPHVEASHRRIIEAAETATRQSVVTVLAAGVCAEIPLDELARRFERVILVDMDGASMLEAVEELPLDLRGKVELRVTDVTTFAARLMERMQEAVDEGDDAEAAFERFESLFDGLRIGEQPVRLPKSDLVISSLVLSELPRYPLAYGDRLVRTSFGVRLRDWSGYQKARERLQRLIVEDHVQLLSSLGEVIYFADTISRGPAYTQFGAETRAAVEARLDDAKLARYCHAEFGIEKEIAAFERLLELYEQAGDDTFEPLVPMEEVRRQWERRDLTVEGAPRSWWWLEYPCAIVHSPGGFRVTSWILRAR